MRAGCPPRAPRATIPPGSCGSIDTGFDHGVSARRFRHDLPQGPIWRILEPIIRAGDTYALGRDTNREAALAYWRAPRHEVFVAEDDTGRIVGTYFLQANHGGGGAHVANCGYVTAPSAGGRGVGRAMCAHSLDRARARGFRAMQFNFVVSTNARARRLWESFGFAIVGRLPGAFEHPTHGAVDAFVMFRTL